MSPRSASSLLRPMGQSNNIPPQAYTKDILAQAFVWVKSQPPAVRQRATSADALVSLYLHFKRHGELGLATAKLKGESGTWEQEAPVSVQSFKSDLKDLAKGLEQFDEKGPTPSKAASAEPKPASSPSTETKAATESSSNLAQEKPSQATQSPASAPAHSAAVPPQGFVQPQAPATNPTPPPAPQPQPSYTQQSYNQSPAAHNGHYQAPQPPSPQAPQTSYQAPNTVSLDERSLDLIRDVQYRLNLSSAEEAVRVLLVFGYERLRDVRPPQY